MEIDKRKELLIDGLNKLIPPKSKVVILDYPNYSNLGDILILVATKKYLRDRGCTLVAEYERRDYDFISQQNLICTKTILLIQGGGNLGDLYYTHQDLRYKIIRDFANNKIIQLPQSIYFKYQDSLLEAAREFSSHENFHLITRDSESFKIANQIMSNGNIYLLPDMATYLVKSRESKHICSNKILCLLREDGESKIESNGVGTNFSLAPKHEKHFIKKDWAQPSFFERVLKLIDRILYKLKIKTFLLFKVDIYHITSLYRSLLEFYRYQKAVRFMQGFSLVITDRLHGYIYAEINKLECRYIDNSTGKIGNYLNTWSNT